MESSHSHSHSHRTATVRLTDRQTDSLVRHGVHRQDADHVVDGKDDDRPELDPEERRLFPRVAHGLCGARWRGGGVWGVKPSNHRDTHTVSQCKRRTRADGVRPGDAHGVLAVVRLVPVLFGGRS